MSTSFFTKTWSGDYSKMLSGGFERKWQNLDYDFDVVGIALNNGVPEEARESFLGMADVILDVPKLEKDALDYFSLPEVNVYARGELACVMACDTDYLVYIQGDCICDNGKWIEEGITILENNPQIMVVSPASEVNTWHGENGLDHYMSDQAFLVRTKDFQDKQVYQVPGHDYDYPDYGGNSFEALVGRYLKKTGRYRKILNSSYVSHPAW